MFTLCNASRRSMGSSEAVEEAAERSYTSIDGSSPSESESEPSESRGITKELIEVRNDVSSRELSAEPGGDSDEKPAVRGGDSPPRSGEP